MRAMQKHYRSSKDIRTEVANWTPIKDLLAKQRKGQFLNVEEKKRINEYAESRRKENLRNKR